jgi:hypothetical protein
MSGAEVSLVLGLISSTITVIESCKKLYDAAKDAHGLPEAFRKVHARIPLVESILRSAEQPFRDHQVNDATATAMKGLVQACNQKVSAINDKFKKVLPTEGAGRLERYYKVVRTLGKGNEVESLMQGILEDIRVLVGDHNLKGPSAADMQKLTEAINDLSDVEPPVPEYVWEESGITAHNSGTGTQYNAHGEYIAQGNDRQYNSGGGAQSFGKD